MFTPLTNNMFDSTQKIRESVSKEYNYLNENEICKSQRYYGLFKDILISIRSAHSLQQLAGIGDKLLQSVTRELFVQCSDHNGKHVCYDKTVKSIKCNSYELCCFHLFALLISAFSRQIIRTYTHLVPASLYLESLDSKTTEVQSSTNTISNTTNTTTTTDTATTKNHNEAADECYEAMMTRVLNNMLETEQRYCQEIVHNFDCKSTHMHSIFTLVTKLEQYMNKLQDVEVVYQSSLYVTGELQDLRKWLQQQCLFLLTKHINRINWNVTDLMFIIADLTEIVEDKKSNFHTEINAHKCTDVRVTQLHDSKDNTMQDANRHNIHSSNKECDEYRYQYEEKEEEEEEKPLEVTELVTPMRDPISQRVIHIPARGKYCTHLELFDLESFIRLVEQRVRQSECSRESCGCKCPFCNQYVLLTDVRIDELALRAVVEYGLYTYHCVNSDSNICDEHNNAQRTFCEEEIVEQSKEQSLESNTNYTELSYSKWREILYRMQNEELTLCWNVQTHTVKVEKSTKRRNASRSTSKSIGDIGDEDDNVVPDEEEEREPQNTNQIKKDQDTAAITLQSKSMQCKDKAIEGVKIISQPENVTKCSTVHNDNKTTTSRLKVHEMSVKPKRRRIEIGNTVMYVDEE